MACSGPDRPDFALVMAFGLSKSGGKMYVARIGLWSGLQLLPAVIGAMNF